jgi:tetratricopeptide (TPR) repeat protein
LEWLTSALGNRFHFGVCYGAEQIVPRQAGYNAVKLTAASSRGCTVAVRASMAVPFAVAAAAAYGQRYMKNKFLKLISELINSAASGRHSGKGHKFIRQGKYEDALRHYELALEYENIGKISPNPATVECVARTHARLGNAEQALSAAEKSYDLYKN